MTGIFSTPHLVDDFLFDMPVEFGISVHLALFLAGVFILICLEIFLTLAGIGVVGTGFVELKNSKKGFHSTSQENWYEYE